MAAWPYNTAQWQRLRRLKLSSSPLCEGCESLGLLTLANVVDHRVAIKAGGEPFPSLDGLSSLCKKCHSEKTARGPEAARATSTKPRKGCRADGSPLDPSHPWSE